MRRISGGVIVSILNLSDRRDSWSWYEHGRRCGGAHGRRYIVDKMLAYREC